MPRGQVPAESAGPAQVKLSEVTKAARKEGPTRKAMTGVPGSGKVGSDSRDGSFRAALGEVAAARPKNLEDNLKTSNRRVATSGSGRTANRAGDPILFRAIDQRDKGPITQPTARQNAASQAIPHHTEIAEGRNDMGAALGRMLSRMPRERIPQGQSYKFH